MVLDAKCKNTKGINGLLVESRLKWKEAFRGAAPSF